MPALPPYIPQRDTDLDSWLANFSTLLTASPSTYGLFSGDAVAVAAVVSNWATAYAAAIAPATRTPVTVSAKDDAKLAALATVRPYAQNISLNPGVLSSDKIAIGVNPRTSTPAQITNPTTYANISITAALSLMHIVYYRDQLASPTVKAKPYGVIGVQIYAKTSATPIVDPAALPWKLTTPKAPVQVDWDSADAGKVAYYTARYITRKGLLGPFSPIVSFIVAA